MKLNLVVLNPGKSEGQTIPVKLAQFLIGRDPQCQLRPASGSISKRHCALLVRGGKVFVRDLDSTNGTFVNDQPVKGEVELHHDDRLKIGPLVFGVRIEVKQAAADKGAEPRPAAKKQAAPAKRTPVEAMDEDSVAAMLLSLQDEGGDDRTEVPQGSTEMERVAAEPGQEPAPTGKEKVPPAADRPSSEAAKEILQKYMRRPRGS